MTQALFLTAAYLLGSIPTAVWLSRRLGKDVRTVGSGNAGATNMLRTFGWKVGLATFLIDMLKGYAAVQWPIWAGFELSSPWQLALGTAAVIGHIFPIWARFRGGKGVATLVGVMLALDPIAAAITLGGVIAVIALSRYVSLGSLVGGLLFAALYAYFHSSNPTARGIWILPVIIIITHRENIRRLLRGQERKLGEKAG